MFTSLYRNAYDLPQAVIGHMLGIDQSTVSDYLAFIKPIEEKILPTPDAIIKEAMRCETYEEGAGSF